jgi:tRNA threonylcarbamoyladenosine biosynthesis protein TsaE
MSEPVANDGERSAIELRLLWPDEDAAQASAEKLAAALLPSPDALIELHGPLGAGKTTFTRLLLRALGVEGRIKSPSYAVMESYALPGGAQASHFDFYRFGDPREWEDAGFRDVFAAPGLKLCEWPEKAAGQLPPADLQLFIELTPDDSRRVRVVGDVRLVEALK